MTLTAVGVMDFAGGFAVGVDQAGFDYVAKREPDAFGGFGAASVQLNFPSVEIEVTAPEMWSIQRSDMVFGCPPCAGFSQLSAANNSIHSQTGKNYRGADADINECMTWLVDYAAEAKPEVLLLESVQAAYKIGQGWMESLWQRLRDKSGVDYKLTHVLMNAALVGGDVIRPRYFMVASTRPFGVGLEFVSPRSFRDVVGDLPSKPEPGDLDWGHVTSASPSAWRIGHTIEWLESQGRVWREGSRLPDNTDGIDEVPEWWLRRDGTALSHWTSTDMFSPFRWRSNQPFGVITGGSLDRAVHAFHPRTLTYREAARLVSLPDDWSLRSIVERRAAPELGKAVTGAAAKWIAHWARMAIEETPGEYAGIQVAKDVRVIDVTDAKKVARIFREDVFEAAWWDGIVPTSDGDPEGWIIDRKTRPATWPEPAVVAGSPARVRAASKAASTLPRTPREARQAPPPPVRAEIVRVRPEVVQKAIDDLGLTRKDAAAALGVSVSRIAEITGQHKPGSWLNDARWDEVLLQLQEYVSVPA